MQLVSPSFTLFTTLILGLLSVSSGSHLGPPTQSPSAACTGDEQQLQISAQTETTINYVHWYLYEWMDDIGDWELIKQRTLKNYYENIDYECLSPDTSYKYVIENTLGTGLCGWVCGHAKLELNSEEFFSVGSELTYKELVTFMTPSDPTGDVIILEDFPSAAPTVLSPCTGDTSWFRVESRNYNIYARWYLYKLDENGNYVQIFEKIQYNSHPQFDNECLDPDSNYKWVFSYTYGDGLCDYDGSKCGYATVLLNEEQIFYTDGRFTNSVQIVFITPSDPTGDLILVSGHPSESPSDKPSVTPSDSSAPSLSPTECDGDTLKIEVHTDFYPWANSWKLELKDEITGEYSVIRTNDLPQAKTTYIDYPCLAEGRSYRWTLTDIYGNGFYCNPFGGKPGDDDCGYYRLTFKGEEIVSPGTFYYHVIKEIGPVECVDYPGTDLIEFLFYRARCKGIRRQIRLRGPATYGPMTCKMSLTDGSGIVADKCKETCSVFGVGPCADDQ